MLRNILYNNNGNHYEQNLGVRRAKTRSILLTLDQSIRSIDIYISFKVY